jgi:16S rRNA pseudouridine516 synthase
MRIDKIISSMGIASRREIAKVAKSGGVLVDGVVIKDPSRHIDPEKNIITYLGRVLRYQTFTYVMLNKPTGYVSATEDTRLPYVLELLSVEHQKMGLFPVGRLDRDTEGLLLITNDGALSHRLLSPKHHVDKVYYAEVSGILNESDVELFAEGLVLSDGLECMPADLKILSASEDEYTSEAEIAIREGKFHQVKRMFSSVGAEVTYLKRLSMGPLSLDPDLKPGECRRLTKEEMEALGI